MDKPLYKKVLLKLSGEVLMGKKSFGIDFDILNSISNEIKNVYDDDIKLSIVIGGGNIFRGVNSKEFSMERTDADYIGMISTIINGITLKNSLKNLKLPVVLYSALKIENVCNSYNIEEAKELLPEGITYVDDPCHAINEADAVVILTEWNAFRGMDLEKIKQSMKDNKFIDLRNIYEPADMKKKGFDYHCIGRNS